MPIARPGPVPLPRQGQIPALSNRLALNPKTQPMARPQMGRTMVDSTGHVIGGGILPRQNQFMPGPFAPGQPGGPSFGFGMPPGIQPPGQLPNTVRTNPAAPMPANQLPNTVGLDPNKPQPANTLPGSVNVGADGPPTDTPPASYGFTGSGGGKGGMGGGKGGFGSGIGGLVSGLANGVGQMVQPGTGYGLSTPGGFYDTFGTTGQQGTPSQGGAQFTQNT